MRIAAALRAGLMASFAAIFCVVITVSYKATPEDARNLRRWDPRLIEHTGKACNGALYPIDVVIAYPRHERQIRPELIRDFGARRAWREVAAGRGIALIRDLYEQAILPHTHDYSSLTVEPTRTLQPGECSVATAEFRRGRERFFVAAHPTSDDMARQARQDVLYFQTGNIATNPAPADLVSRQIEVIRLNAPSRPFAATVRDLVLPACDLRDAQDTRWTPRASAAAEPIYVSGRARPFACMHPDETTGYFIGFDDPYAPVLSRNKKGWVIGQEAGLQRARAGAADLKQLWAERASAKAAQERFRGAWNLSRPLPYMFAQVADPNGPRYPGVFVESIPHQDLFGQPVSVPDGVWIMKVNGRPVFGEADLLDYVFAHANSRTAGIEKSISVEFFDGKTTRTGVSRYWFNPAYFRGNWSGVAAWHGFLDGYGFGTSATSTCMLSAGVGALADMLRGETTRRVSHEECRWVEIQRKGIARQFNNDSYNGAIWLALPFSGGVRAIGSRSTLKAASQGGRAGRALNAVAWEAAETALGDMALAPPETPFSRRLAQSTKAAAVGGGLGLAGNLAFGK